MPFNCYGRCLRRFEQERPAVSDADAEPKCPVCFSDCIEIITDETAAEAAEMLAEKQREAAAATNGSASATVAAAAAAPPPPDEDFGQLMASALRGLQERRMARLTQRHDNSGAAITISRTTSSDGTETITHTAVTPGGASQTTVINMGGPLPAFNPMQALLGPWSAMLNPQGGDDAMTQALLASFQEAVNGGPASRENGVARVVLDSLPRKPIELVVEEHADDGDVPTCAICLSSFAEAPVSPATPETSAQQFPAASPADGAAASGERGSKRVVVQLPCCGSRFHESCILTWLRSHCSCVLCRHKFARESEL